jgi:hypothetical protein
LRFARSDGFAIALDERSDQLDHAVPERILREASLVSPTRGFPESKAAVCIARKVDDPIGKSFE